MQDLRPGCARKEKQLVLIKHNPIYLPLSLYSFPVRGSIPSWQGLDEWRGNASLSAYFIIEPGRVQHDSGAMFLVQEQVV